ncbi:TetR/AcrR family transcriptional regulator [Mycobacterium sp. C31M]
MTERRRGSALEQELLDAAYAELTERGYAKFTLEGVATRAGTSTPVLYRRWSDKHDLLRASIGHAAQLQKVHCPDTGNLRDDVLTLMRQANDAGLELVATISVHLGGYFQETGTSPADLRDHLSPALPAVAILATIYERAAARGEVDAERLTARMRTLPFDLLRAELLMNLRPLPDADLIEIVDTIYLPVVQPGI